MAMCHMRGAAMATLNQTPGSSGTGLRANWDTFGFAAANREQVMVNQEAADNIAGRWHSGKEMLSIGEL